MNGQVSESMNGSLRMGFATAIVVWCTAATSAQNDGLLRPHINFVKLSPFEDGGPAALLGDQAALTVYWTLVNESDVTVPLPPLQGLLSLVVSQAGIDIPSETVFDVEAKLAGEGRLLGDDASTLGGLLPSRARLSMLADVRRVDGKPFGPGRYMVRFDVSDLQRELDRLSNARVTVDKRISSPVRIRQVVSIEDARNVHLIEAATARDPESALAHRRALATGAGSTWADLLQLGRALAALGRHAEAVAEYRRALPGLDGALASQPEMIRATRHYRTIALSFAAENLTREAERLLTLEGVESPKTVSLVVEALREKAHRERQRRR